MICIVLYNLHTISIAVLSMKNERGVNVAKIVSEYDQEIPQSQTADNPAAP